MGPPDELALAADCEHEDGVDVGDDSVQREAAAQGLPDDQFTLATLDLAADERALGQDLHGLSDLRDARWRIGGLETGQVLDETIEVVQNFGRQFDAGHATCQRTAGEERALVHRSSMRDQTAPIRPSASPKSQTLKFPLRRRKHCMGTPFNPFFAGSDQVLLGGHLLAALEVGRMPMHAADYREISTWMAEVFDDIDLDVLVRLQREGPSALRPIAENALCARGEPDWVVDAQARRCAERAWCGLRRRLTSV